MAQNNPIAFMSRLFGNQAAFNNSQHGSLTPLDALTGQPQAGHPFLSAMDKARPVLDFFTGAYSAHAANPQAGGTAMAGLGNVVNSAARRNYMNQLQQQYRHEQDIAGKQRLGNQGLYGAALGQERADGMENLQYVDPDAFAKVAPHIGNADFGQGAQTIAQGGYPTWGMAPAPQVSASSNQMMSREGATRDNADTLATIPVGLQGGQQGSLLFNSLMNMGNPIPPGQGQGQPPMSSGALDISFQNPPLEESSSMFSVGASQSQPFQPPALNPYFRSAADPSVAMEAWKAGLGDTQEAGQQRETSYHNRQTEGLNRDIHDARKANQGGYAHYAPNPPQPNAFGLAQQLYDSGGMTQEQYIRSLGGMPGSGERPTIPSDNQAEFMEALKTRALGSNGGFMGWGKADPDPVALQQYNQYAAKYGYQPLSAGAMIQAAQTTGSNATGKVRSAGEWMQNQRFNH